MRRKKKKGEKNVKTKNRNKNADKEQNTEMPSSGNSTKFQKTQLTFWFDL